MILIELKMLKGIEHIKQFYQNNGNTNVEKVLDLNIIKKDYNWRK